MALVAERSGAVVLLLVIHFYCCTHRFVGVCPRFVVQYFVSFLVLQSPRRGKGTWLLYAYCLLMSSEC